MVRYYKGKRIGANLYTQGKFGKRLRETLDTENTFLYSDGRYPTKLTAADLPEDYIKIHSRVIWYMKGYLRTSGIVDMKYTWVRENHLFKDDYIYISYHGPLKEVTSRWGFRDIDDYDICVCGNDIIDIVLAQKGILASIHQKSGLKLRKKESGCGITSQNIIRLVGLKTEVSLSSG